MLVLSVLYRNLFRNQKLYFRGCKHSCPHLINIFGKLSKKDFKYFSGEGIRSNIVAGIVLTNPSLIESGSHNLAGLFFALTLHRPGSTPSAACYFYAAVLCFLQALHDAVAVLCRW